MNDEAKDIELELQPLSMGARRSAGFDEPGAAGFSLLPAQPSEKDSLESLTLVRVERFHFE